MTGYIPPFANDTRWFVNVGRSVLCVGGGGGLFGRFALLWGGGAVRGMRRGTIKDLPIDSSSLKKVGMGAQTPGASGREVVDEVDEGL